MGFVIPDRNSLLPFSEKIVFSRFCSSSRIMPSQRFWLLRYCTVEERKWRLNPQQNSIWKQHKSPSYHWGSDA